eukprot:3412073-Pleurochrysis_carterae.AAC.1
MRKHRHNPGDHRPFLHMPRAAQTPKCPRTFHSTYADHTLRSHAAASLRNGPSVSHALLGRVRRQH